MTIHRFSNVGIAGAGVSFVILLFNQAGWIANFSKSPHWQINTTFSNAYENCTQKLDALDTTFDARRDARKKITTKHVDEELDSDRLAYDYYEAEANCISEERFGSQRNRYAAYGDGPKFVCGVDLLAKKAKEDCLIYSVGSNNRIDFEVVRICHCLSAILSLLGGASCFILFLACDLWLKICYCLM